MCDIRLNGANASLVLTSYVDPREPGRRTPIHTLVKGCKREHAVEDTETIQMFVLPDTSRVLVLEV